MPLRIGDSWTARGEVKDEEGRGKIEKKHGKGT
jgi:hypothetical protein